MPVDNAIGVWYNPPHQATHGQTIMKKLSATFKLTLSISETARIHKLPRPFVAKKLQAMGEFTSEKIVQSTKLKRNGYTPDDVAAMADTNMSKTKMKDYFGVSVQYIEMICKNKGVKIKETPQANNLGKNRKPTISRIVEVPAEELAMRKWKPPKHALL